MWRRLCLIAALIVVACILSGFEAPISNNFDIVLTKIGDSTYYFSTYDSAFNDEPVQLVEGIGFSSPAENPDGPDSSASFGVVWDLFIERDSTVSMTLQFSAAEDGSADYMLVNKENSGAVLNYSVSGTVQDNMSDPVSSSQLSGITIPTNSINATNFTNRTVTLFTKQAEAFERVYGAAKIELSLEPPYISSGDQMVQTEFVGGEYNGFAILTLQSR